MSKPSLHNASFCLPLAKQIGKLSLCQVVVSRVASLPPSRCWNTLGLAIRVGQSIGLHVEDSLKRPKTSAGVEKQETMRRTWYSMYVLDRLLALQLGRPAAIHENDYCVNLPSRTGESVSTDDHQQGLYINPEHSSLDYFLSVIKFSWILGRVINDLYSPSQVVQTDYEEMLLKTTSLDLLLSEWKRNLPRHLRFDLGHTFERSVVFRRQVNFQIPVKIMC